MPPRYTCTGRGVLKTRAKLPGEPAHRGVLQQLAGGAFPVHGHTCTSTIALTEVREAPNIDTCPTCGLIEDVLPGRDA